jgi:hypothetical protein
MQRGVNPLGRQHEVRRLADGDSQVAQPPLAAEAVRTRIHRIAGTPGATQFQTQNQSQIQIIVQLPELILSGPDNPSS